MTKCDRVTVCTPNGEERFVRKLLKKQQQPLKNAHFRNYEERQAKCEDHGQSGR